MEVELLEERIGYYAHLKHSEDAGNSDNQKRMGEYMAVATKLQAASSYITPEILSIEKAEMDAMLKDEVLAEYRIFLNKIF